MQGTPCKISESCQPVLAPVVLAYRPLHPVELGILSVLPLEISSNPKYIRDVVALCGSFLTVNGNFVYVIHQSGHKSPEDMRAFHVNSTS